MMENDFSVIRKLDVTKRDNLKEDNCEIKKEKTLAKCTSVHASKSYNKVKTNNYAKPYLTLPSSGVHNSRKT